MLLTASPPCHLTEAPSVCILHECACTIVQQVDGAVSGSDDEREQEHEDGKPAHSEASRAAQQRESTGGGDVMRGIQGRGAVLGVEQEKGGTRRESGTDSAEQQPSRVGVRGFVKDRGEDLPQAPRASERLRLVPGLQD